MAVVCQFVAGAVSAQDQPLSVIEWLHRNPDHATSVAMPLPGEPPVARSGSAPEVDTQTLDTDAIRQIGLVPPSVTGLPADLWERSDARRLTELLERVPDLDVPAAQALLYTVLLSEAQGPADDNGSQDIFTLARVATLVRFGALDPALALIEQAGITRDKAHFAAYLDISLLTGTEDIACANLMAHPALAPGYAEQIFCAARQSDWATASVIFDTVRSLSLLPEADIDLLDRFLNPDLFEDAEPLPVSSSITPLTFRLHETIGESLPTRSLPREYAVADLRDLAGWKAQLEAAERLTRTGALPDNSLLGIYTARLPAASGGIWDRVEALQLFETALDTRSPAAVAKTLPPVWRAMQDAELEVTFAALFADRLTDVPLSGRAGDIAYQMRMLSPGYEAAAATGPQDPVLQAIATGDAARLRPQDPVAEAIQRGFSGSAINPELRDMAAQGRLGEAILRILRLLQDGAHGDTQALASALGTLRALGLEDTARRAALQMMVLERFRG